MELHLLPLHLSSNRKLLCRTVCLVSPFYIELRMRSCYIFKAEITILCTGRMRPVKTLLFLLCQELGHPWLSSHHHCGHFPSSQLGQLITNLHSPKWHGEISLQEQSAQGNSFELEGRNLCCRWGQNLGWEGS